MKSINFNEFMTGDYKVKEKKKKQRRWNTAAKLATSAALPLATGGMVGTLGMVAVAKSAFAQSTAIEAVPATAKEWMGEQTLSALAHVLDPVIDILVALSLPVASVVIVGACFFFMFGSAEKAWGMIQNAGLGYVLIQVSPLILNVLQQVGNAV
jgi:hypothetical protein